MAKIASAQFAQFTIAAGASENVSIPHEFIHCITSTGAFYIKTREGGGRIYCATNTKIRHESQVQAFDIVNESASSITVQLIIGFGDYDLGGVSIAGTVNTLCFGGQQLTQGARTVGVAASLLVAADANGTGWTIANNGTATIYLGSSSAVTTLDGFPILPGEKFGWDARTDVYAISGTAGQDVRYIKTAV